MNAGTLIATILRHDRKTASYKIALIRSLNDLALGYAHLGGNGVALAVPLRSLAVFWIAYYWPFVSAAQPIQQGIHPENKQDISFRPALTKLRLAWEQLIGVNSLASDGFYLISEFQSSHRRSNYPPEIITAYDRAIRDISVQSSNQCVMQDQGNTARSIHLKLGNNCWQRGTILFAYQAHNPTSAASWLMLS